ncbi:hypothetical protein DYB38_010072 [Aphanomyces astaci]|uniref:VPS9 domain-containing protein n=2 Tax=Aphanomyces astaci TaxID=112090 RepID=A0A397C6E4_APHAT|nr:hypothetical protein DYB38_010072 [Aphanomyces astaci]
MVFHPDTDTPLSVDYLDDSFSDLEEELMDSPKNASSYLGDNSSFPRRRAMSVPSHNEIDKSKRQESLHAFQALRNLADRPSIHTQSTLDVRSALVARVVDAASARPSSRRPRTISSTSSISRPHSVFVELFVDLPPVEKQALAQLVDDDFTTRAMMGASPAATIDAHFRAIFRSATTTNSLTRPIKHSLGTVVLEFAQVFHALYQQHMHTYTKDADITAQAAADVIEFSNLLVQVIQFKYPFLATPSVIPCVEQVVEDALFVHLQPTLHGVFVAHCSVADASLTSIMSSLRKSTCVAASVNVPLIYLLDMPAQETLPYAAAIAKMAELPHRRSPSAKIAVVSNVCHLIDDAVQRYYAIHPNPPPMDKRHM